MPMPDINSNYYYDNDYYDNEYYDNSNNDIYDNNNIDVYQNNNISVDFTVVNNLDTDIEYKHISEY